MAFRPRWPVWLLAGVVAVVVIVYVDVVSRAKTAFLEGEKYMDWHAHPDKKKAQLHRQLEVSKAALARQRDRKKITEEEFAEKAGALQFDYDYALSESSLKYAYQWYKDTYELFSPPESKWVRLARQQAPIALDLWKKELNAQNIPFEDRHFD
jgi:hypothetical protein